MHLKYKGFGEKQSVVTKGMFVSSLVFYFENERRRPGYMICLCKFKQTLEIIYSFQCISKTKYFKITPQKNVARVTDSTVHHRFYYHSFFPHIVKMNDNFIWNMFCSTNAHENPIVMLSCV